MGISHCSLPFHRICGLHPEVWLSVGAGFAREDVKSLVLAQGQGFVGDAILTIQEICLRVTEIPKDRVLGPTSRQEVLRMLLSEPRIASEMTELKNIRRQKSFFKRLDLAMQSGRMTFAHDQEEEVYHERLIQSLGENLLRKEVRLLARAYDAWVEATSWVDLPLLIRKATHALREKWPDGLARPQEIWVLSAQTAESLEKEFWDVVKQHIPVQLVTRLEGNSSQPPTLDWQRWHTLDDATEALAEKLASEDQSKWNEQALLIPDIPVIRRSLNRALEARGLPLADPRDPTRLRWDEAVKWALLPLELVGRNFERHRVISWLRSYQMQEEFPAWVQEINSRGIRNSLFSYSGGMLAGVHSRLEELEKELGGRKTCQELSEAHLKILRSHVKVQPEFQSWIPFFEQTWKLFLADMERVGIAARKAPPLFWLERLESRIYEASPPVERIKIPEGIRIYRLQQAPVLQAQKLWILGLPPLWFSGEGNSSYWFSEREREVLSLEFSVRSSLQVHDERLQILETWIQGSQEVTFLDYQYDVDGRERESILPALREIELKLGQPLPESPQEMGSHPRFSKSYGAVRPIQPQEVDLPRIPRRPGGNGPELTATTLDRFSRCSFQALAYHRWNLKDVREPDIDLWPEVRGNILHEAVRLLLESMDPSGHFGILPREALHRAWKQKRPKGLIRSARVENYVKTRLQVVLEAFCEKEREYIQRAGTRPISLDDLSLRLDYPEFSIIGQPDRIDEHPEGVFILDYKSSGSVPHGTEMLEKGYRLQLPFYAVAARKRLARRVLGVQFVELDRKGTRRNGVFFKEYNGKDKGCLTQARGNSKSLLSRDPEEVWDEFERVLVEDAQKFIQGQFAAQPKVSQRDKECQRCRLGDLCGLRRRIESEAEEGGGDA